VTGDRWDSVPLSEQQTIVRRSIRDRCSDFDDDYWRRRDREGEYPSEFVDALAEDGRLGVLVPKTCGGVGMGTPETVVMMEEIAGRRVRRGTGGSRWRL